MSAEISAITFLFMLSPAICLITWITLEEIAKSYGIQSALGAAILWIIAVAFLGLLLCGCAGTNLHAVNHDLPAQYQ